MILTCEKCHTRYLLASHMLGYEGRRVRCTHCGHEWFQEKEDESDDTAGTEQEEGVTPLESFLNEEDAGEAESFDDEEEEEDDDDNDNDKNPFKSLLNKMNEDEEGEVEESDGVFALSERTGSEEEYPPVPEGVLPDSGGNDAGKDEEPAIEKEPMDWSVAVGGVLVILVLTVSMAGFIIFHKSVISALPATASLYRVMGIEAPVQGEGLVFDNVKAISKPDKSGKDVLYIEGNILNLTKEDKSVPKIEASLRRKDGGVADKWVFKARAVKVAAEGKVPFTTSYSQTVKDVAEVNVRFVLQ